MALLTLVENAIRHGIDPAEHGGALEVRAWRDAADGAVHVAVIDTGVGLRETALPGTGLANLRARLQAFYGASARLDLLEVQPHGGSAPRSSFSTRRARVCDDCGDRADRDD